MGKNYTYIAVDSTGKKRSGNMEIGSRSEAMRRLHADGLRPLSITESSSKREKSPDAELNDEPIVLNNKNVIAFTEELSELLEAGLPLEPALASMEKREESGVLKIASTRLRQRVTEGEQMYQSLPRVSNQFDQLYCNLVKAGEASGSLQTILKQHGSFLKEQMELRSKLTQAMIYPCFLILACVIVTLVFIFYLLPQITSLLEGMPNSEMPLGVKIATSVGNFLENQWVLLLVFAVAVMLGIKLWHQTESNKVKWDEAKLTIPIMGKVIQYGIYVQWLQTLGNLLSNGVPLVQALELTTETVKNRHFKKYLGEISDGVGDGYRLTRCMRKTDMFPANMVDLIAVGESTGKLARAMNRAADYYDKRLSVLIKSVLGLISPIVLLAMAGLVAVLSYTMIQAIYETMSNVNYKR